MSKSIYEMALDFKAKYPNTVAWRLKKNSEIVQRHLNPDEKPLYVFAAQKNDNPLDFIETCVVTLTNQRILIGRKRVFFGYFLDSITPDMFNDLNVKSGIFWGKIYIDTIKEFVTLSNISKSALTEIETKITSFMMCEKKKYGIAPHTHKHDHVD